MVDLDALIEEVREEGFADSYAITTRVLERMDPRDLREALEEALPVYIRHRQRMHRLAPAEAIRNLTRFLDGAHWIDGQWKLARDMSAADCRWLAADYQKRGDANGTRADAWFGLSRVLEEGPSRKVGSLPQEKLLAVLG